MLQCYVMFSRVNEMFESLGLGFVDLPDGEKHSLLEIPYPPKFPETMLF